MRSGKLLGKDINGSHLLPRLEEAATIYLGAVAATTPAAKGLAIAVMRERINTLVAAGVKEFLTCPFTERGLELAIRYGFEPYGKKSGIGALYVRSG